MNDFKLLGGLGNRQTDGHWLLGSRFRNWKVWPWNSIILFLSYCNWAYPSLLSFWYQDNVNSPHPDNVSIITCYLSQIWSMMSSQMWEQNLHLYLNSQLTISCNSSNDELSLTDTFDNLKCFSFSLVFT